jgi:holliday junction DNA helicase RuvA
VISQIAGRVVTKELDRVEIATSGGVTYDIAIPLTAFESLPAVGEPATLFTSLVVREDEWHLFGFPTARERRVFRRLLAATGVGPALALGMLSALSAERLVRAIREKDLAALQSVPRVGKKKAQQLVLDLAEKLDDLMEGEPASFRPGGAMADDALRALVSLGYTQGEAEKGVRAALENTAPTRTAPELIRAALAEIGNRK